MTARATLQIDDESDVSVSVGVAALSLGCDPSTVRALLRTGQLSGHKVGKGARPGGVRVHEVSIRAYKRRKPTPMQDSELEARLAVAMPSISRPGASASRARTRRAAGTKRLMAARSAGD